MASTGQNVHLVLPHNHVVVSSCHLANSSSQLVLSSSLSQSVVELSRRVVESSRRVVFFDLLSRCAITRLFFNSSYYLATISCTVLRKRGDLRDLGTTTEQSNMSAVEPMDELKECLRASVEMLLDKLNDRLLEDMDGVHYLCVQLDEFRTWSREPWGCMTFPWKLLIAIKGGGRPTRLLPHAKMLLIPIRLFLPAG